MKWSTILAAVILPSTALSHVVSKRDDVTTTDTYLFSISLDEFIANRNALNPATLDFTSDGCTSSPENPLGFDFEPSCNRHDFGYVNYRAQSRFTVAAKASIDKNFLSDMKNTCSEESWLESVCEGLADVYYAAVVAFGGEDASKRGDADAVAEYAAKLAAYEALLAEVQANGDIQ